MATDYSDLGLPDSTLVKPITGAVQTINPDTQIEDSSISNIKLMNPVISGTKDYPANQSSSAAGTHLVQPSIVFTLTRTTNVFLIYNCELYAKQLSGASTMTVGTTLDVDGSVAASNYLSVVLLSKEFQDKVVTGLTTTAVVPVTGSGIVTLPAGTHTVTMAIFGGDPGLTEVHIYNANIQYIIFSG